MNLTIETAFIKGKKKVDTLAVSLDVNQLAGIAKTKGLQAANVALNKFVAHYTADLKKKLSAAINQ